MSTRKAVVSYSLNSSVREKKDKLLEGIRECVIELIELSTPKDIIIDVIEQIGSDIETDM